MSDLAVLDWFDDRAARGEPLVLATVIGTEGSTYSKAGHRSLIAANGDYQGLVSGGCLEGDLAEHARAVLASGEPETVRYDMRGDNDILWGMGIGCDGMIEVLLQPLQPAADYQPFRAIAGSMRGSTAVDCKLLLDGPRAGSALLHAGDDVVHDGIGGELASAARQEAAGFRARVAVLPEGQRVLTQRLRRVPRLLVLGAGPDAGPLVDYAARAGWRVTAADHRPAYLARGGLSACERLLEIVPASLGATLALDQFDAAVVMSHHLESDRGWLGQLARSAIPYIGLLGPAARRERLLTELGDDTAAALRARLHGPAGLPIGADSPETIALAIIAEVQQLWAARHAS